MGREVGSQSVDGSGRRRRRVRVSLKVLVPTVAALGAGAAIAVGQIPGSDGTITGCVLTNNDDSTQPVGSLRVIDPTGTDTDPAATSCGFGEQTLTWNQQGPQGPQGPAGAPGATGAAGATGPPGPAGPAGTVQVSSGPGVDIFMYLAPPDNLGQLSPEPVGETQTLQSQTKEFEVASFSLAATNSTTIGSATSGAGAGKTKFEKFQFTKPLDKYSAQLFLDLTSGTHIPSIEIVVRKPGADGMEMPVVQYMLKLVALTNIEVSGASRDATETVQAEFGAISFALYGQNAAGQPTKPTIGGWSQVTNSPVAVPGFSPSTAARAGRAGTSKHRR
jgi:type VI secretion system secreted protein Hcp